MKINPWHNFFKQHVYCTRLYTVHVLELNSKTKIGNFPKQIYMYSMYVQYVQYSTVHIQYVEIYMYVKITLNLRYNFSKI